VAGLLGIAVDAVEMEDATPSTVGAIKPALRRRLLEESVTIDFSVRLRGPENKVTAEFLRNLGAHPGFLALLCQELNQVRIPMAGCAAHNATAAEKVDTPVRELDMKANETNGTAVDEEGQALAATLNKTKMSKQLADKLSKGTEEAVANLLARRQANLARAASMGNASNASVAANAVPVGNTTSPAANVPKPVSTTAAPKTFKTSSIVGAVELTGYTLDNLRDVFGARPLKRIIAKQAGNGATQEMVSLDKFSPSTTGIDSVVVNFRVWSSVKGDNAQMAMQNSIKMQISLQTFLDKEEKAFEEFKSGGLPLLSSFKEAGHVFVEPPMM
jgi:hypothetical protein